MTRLAGLLIAALYLTPAPAAIVGQTLSVNDTTIACPSVAALNSFEKRSVTEPALASKGALAAGCEEVSASDQGTIVKIAGANVCVIFSTPRRGCLWIPARAASGRIDQTQNPGQAAPSLPDAVQGLGKLFGF